MDPDKKVLYLDISCGCILQLHDKLTLEDLQSTLNFAQSVLSVSIQAGNLTSVCKDAPPATWAAARTSRASWGGTATWGGGDTTNQRGARKPRVCFECQQPGHFANECPQKMGVGGDQSSRRSSNANAYGTKSSSTGTYGSAASNYGGGGAGTYGGAGSGAYGGGGSYSGGGSYAGGGMYSGGYTAGRPSVGETSTLGSPVVSKTEEGSNKRKEWTNAEKSAAKKSRQSTENEWLPHAIVKVEESTAVPPKIKNMPFKHSEMVELSDEDDATDKPTPTNQLASASQQAPSPSKAAPKAVPLKAKGGASKATSVKAASGVAKIATANVPTGKGTTPTSTAASSPKPSNTSIPMKRSLSPPAPAADSDDEEDSLLR